jgi:hypothetical protein
MFKEFNFNIVYAILIMLFCILLSSSAVYAGTFNDVQNLIDSVSNGGTVDLSTNYYWFRHSYYY